MHTDTHDQCSPVGPVSTSRCDDSSTTTTPPPIPGSSPGVAAPAPAPPSAGIDPRDHARVLADLEAARAQIANAEAAKGKQATDAEVATLQARLDELTASHTAVQESAQQAVRQAQRNATKAYLSGLRQDRYLDLAPAVTLTDAGDLTDEAKAALDGFRSGAPELFGSAPSTSPVARGGSPSTSDMSPEHAALLRAVNVRPGAAVGSDAAKQLGWIFAGMADGIAMPTESN